MSFTNIVIELFSVGKNIKFSILKLTNLHQIDIIPNSDISSMPLII